MKKLLFILATALLLAAGCKGEKAAKPVEPAADEASGNSVNTGNTVSKASETNFSFEELFTIFSAFGSNIMTDKFAAQSIKDGIREELRAGYDDYREFEGGACNHLSYDFFNGDCYDGFQLGCWKYKADGHVLVLLAENGGCDASATKYIRAYDYDPAANNAHEVELPLTPVPSADDFNDIIRLAGCEDLDGVREAMRDRIYNYQFDPKGLTVDLNTLDNWDVAGYSALQLYYRWNGSEFVRDEDVPVPCIHGEGFALIKLGQPIPDLYIQPDPAGYGIRYSQGGDLWLVNRGEQDVLQIQMEDGKVFSVEIFDPRYSITRALYWDGEGKLRVGSRFSELMKSHSTDVLVWLYSDGTVSAQIEQYNILLELRGTKDDLQGKLPEVSANEVKALIENPKFRPEARIRSILLQEKH
ncbi:MAG: hypothetical protein IJL93_07315 [Bacteroidales bacterium]|nr:hypothetical protein [Bacteroidales bacterium]